MGNTKNIQPLDEAIQALHPDSLSDSVAADAARNLAGFFELLMTIKQENQEEGNASCESLKLTSHSSSHAMDS